MKNLSIDIETFSSENLTKCGVYRYAEAPDFEVLLFGYSADGAPVKVVDLTAGETLPADVRSALTDTAVTKWAFNAQFERVCLSRYLGYPTGQYLDPSAWHCTMVWAATLGLPLSGRRRCCAGSRKAEAQRRQRPHSVFLHFGKIQGRFAHSTLSDRCSGEMVAVQSLQPPGCGNGNVHPAETLQVPGHRVRVAQLHP